jgi:hypothetical protein
MSNPSGMRVTSESRSSRKSSSESFPDKVPERRVRGLARGGIGDEGEPARLREVAQRVHRATRTAGERCRTGGRRTSLSYFSAPDATGSDGRGFATAAGREHFSEVVTAIESEDGRARGGSSPRRRNFPDEWGRYLETLRRQILKEGAEPIAKAQQDPLSPDRSQEAVPLRAEVGNFLELG